MILLLFCQVVVLSRSDMRSRVGSLGRGCEVFPGGLNLFASRIKGTFMLIACRT